MKAKILPNHVSRYNPNHRKDDVKVHFSQLSVISLSAKPWSEGRMPEEITLRLYGTGTKNYAAIWIAGEGDHRGTGQAGGYGYHRPSVAASEAIRNAGIELDEDISGVGDAAIRTALMAIAKALKIKRPALIEAHP
jgi:hypothetical protein